MPLQPFISFLNILKQFSDFIEIAMIRLKESQLFIKRHNVSDTCLIINVSLCQPTFDMTIIRDPRSGCDFFCINSEYCCMPHYRLVSLDMIGTNIEYVYLHFLHKTVCSFWMISIIDCVITRVNNIYFQPVSFLSVCNG